MSVKLLILLMFLIALPELSLGQIQPIIGTNASGFLLFTANGALTGSNAPVVSGVIGTNLGNYSGFSPSVVFHKEDGISQLAANEMATFSFTSQPCSPAPATPLGNAQTLTSGVYCATDATIFSGDLTLDGDADDLFIFEIAGALTMQTSARILLINGASLNNVYFKVSGAVTLSAGSVFRGTIINTGAISLTNATLIGKALTTGGEITVNNSTVASSEAVLPVTLTSFKVKKDEGQTALLLWTTTMESNSDRFDIQTSKTGKAWLNAGSVQAKGESSELQSYTYKIENQGKGTHFYRLKMVDKDETFSYSRIQTLEFIEGNQTTIYPNPTADQLTVRADNIDHILRIQFMDTSGKSVYDKVRSNSSQLSPNLTIGHFAPGLYVAKITLASGDTEYFKIVKQ